MNPKRTLKTSWITMVVIQTIGSIDGLHKMPAPKQYAAINVLWGILLIAADTRAARFAAQFSWLVLIGAVVLGPFGKRLVEFLELVAKYFAIRPDKENKERDTADTYEPEGPVYA